MIGSRFCLSPVSDGVPSSRSRVGQTKPCCPPLYRAWPLTLEFHWLMKHRKAKLDSCLRTGAVNGSGHTPHSATLRQWAIRRLDMPPPPDPAGRGLHRYKIRSSSPVFLANNAKRQRDPVLGSGRHRPSMRCLSVDGEKERHED